MIPGTEFLQLLEFPKWLEPGILYNPPHTRVYDKEVMFGKAPRAGWVAEGLRLSISS